MLGPRTVSGTATTSTIAKLPSACSANIPIEFLIIPRRSRREPHRGLDHEPPPPRASSSSGGFTHDPWLSTPSRIIDRLGVDLPRLQTDEPQRQRVGLMLGGEHTGKPALGVNHRPAATPALGRYRPVIPLPPTKAPSPVIARPGGDITRLGVEARKAGRERGGCLMSRRATALRGFAEPAA